MSAYRLPARVNGWIGDMQFAPPRRSSAAAVTSLHFIDARPAPPDDELETTAGLFRRRERQREVDAGEAVLRRQTLLTGGNASLPTTACAAITFNRDGFAGAFLPQRDVDLRDSTTASGLNPLRRRSLRRPHFGAARRNRKLLVIPARSPLVNRSASSGFGLIEVMIAVVVIAVGLLGSPRCRPGAWQHAQLRHAFAHRAPRHPPSRAQCAPTKLLGAGSRRRVLPLPARPSAIRPERSHDNCTAAVCSAGAGAAFDVKN